MFGRAVILLTLMTAFLGVPRAAELRRDRPARLFSTLMQTDRLLGADPTGLTLGLGAEFRPGWRQPYSGLEGDLLQVPIYRLDVSLAPRVGLRLEGALWERLDVDGDRADPEPGFESTSTREDFGSPTFSMVLDILQPRRRRPGVGVVFGVRFPSSDEEEGIGLDTTDVQGHAVMQWERPSGALVLNVGAAILESPTTLQEQSDVLTWGVLGRRRLSGSVDLVGEINGRSSTRTQTFRGTDDRHSARLGLAGRAGRLGWEAMLVQGLKDIDGDLGVAAAVSWAWSRR